MSRKRRSSSPARSAPARRGAQGRGRGEHALERAVLGEQRRRGLRADAARARGGRRRGLRAARSGRGSARDRRRYARAPRRSSITPGGSSRRSSITLVLRVDRLVEVAVAGADQRPPAARGLDARVGPHQVVGLERRVRRDGPAERVEQLRARGPTARAARRASGRGGRGRAGRARRGSPLPRRRYSTPRREERTSRRASRIVFTVPSSALTGIPSAPLIVRGIPKNER